ncbi:hypothetical protein HaLaN_05687 [Haematococcus lacustris]|uniref:Uncharacterized protein n=1 Tax=Haematococcus lacustris TaxID=44745 RepID=A0A699YUB7_HAELA|nr:hypothetical protein HaLaN_05687 [Haematococcus lacustris]
MAESASLKSGPPNSDVLACKTVTCDRLLREQADGCSPARHGLSADSSSGNQQRIRLWSTGWIFRIHHSKPKQVFSASAAAPLSRSPSTTDPSCPQYLPAAHPSRLSCLPTTSQHLRTSLLPDMPRDKSHKIASRANGAKAQAHHEATVAHATLTDELLRSQELYS